MWTDVGISLIWFSLRRFILRDGSPPQQFALRELLDLGLRKPKLVENFGGVLADGRRLMDEPEIMIAHLNRQARYLGMHPVGKVDVEHAAAGIKLRVFKQIAGFRDRCERDSETIEQFGKIPARVLRHDGGDHRQQHGTLADAIFVGLVGRVVQKSSRPKCSQKRCHCASLVTPTKICSLSAVVNGS